MGKGDHQHLPATTAPRRESAERQRRERVERAKVIIIAVLKAKGGSMGIYRLAREARVPVDVVRRVARELEATGAVTKETAGGRIVVHLRVVP